MKIVTFDISRLYLFEKRTIVKIFLYSGMLLAYFGSLNPWFLWPLGPFYIVPACCLIVVAMLVSNSMEKPYFNRRDFLFTISAYVILLCYQLFVNDASFAGFVVQVFNIFIFLSLFRTDADELLRLVTFLSKVMAVLLSISIHFILFVWFTISFTKCGFWRKRAVLVYKLLFFHDRGQYFVFFDNPAFQFCFFGAWASWNCYSATAFGANGKVEKMVQYCFNYSNFNDFLTCGVCAFCCYNIF